jgi:hypothetical protein
MRARGREVSRKRVARLMKKQQLQARRRIQHREAMRAPPLELRVEAPLSGDRSPLPQPREELLAARLEILRHGGRVLEPLQVALQLSPCLVEGAAARHHLDQCLLRTREPGLRFISLNAAPRIFVPKHGTGPQGFNDGGRTERRKENARAGPLDPEELAPRRERLRPIDEVFDSPTRGRPAGGQRWSKPPVKEVRAEGLPGPFPEGARRLRSLTGGRDGLRGLLFPGWPWRRGLPLRASGQCQYEQRPDGNVPKSDHTPEPAMADVSVARAE